MIHLQPLRNRDSNFANKTIKNNSMSTINFEALFSDMYELKYMEKKEAPRSCITINEHGGISFSKGLLEDLFPEMDDNIPSQEDKVISARKIAFKSNEEKLEAIYKVLSREEVITEEAKQTLSNFCKKDASNVTKATLKEFLYTNCLSVELNPNPELKETEEVFIINEQNSISCARLAKILGKIKNANIRYEVENNEILLCTKETLDVNHRKKVKK